MRQYLGHMSRRYAGVTPSVAIIAITLCIILLSCSLPTWATQRIFEREPNPVTQQLAMSSDMRFIAAANGDGQILIWNVDSPVALADIKIFNDVSDQSLNIASLHISPHGESVTVLLDDGAVVIYSVSSQKLISLRAAGTNGRLSLAQLTHDAQDIVERWDSGSVRELSTSDGREISSYALQPGKIESASVSEDGSMAAIENEGRNTTLYSLLACSSIASLPGSLWFNAGTDFSVHGDRFICSSRDLRGVIVWIKNRKTLRFATNVSPYIVPRLALSPDGSLVAISDIVSYAEVLSIDPQGMVTRNSYTIGNPKHVDLVNFTSAMMFSPDGSSLLMGNRYGGVSLWQFRIGKEILLGPQTLEASEGLAPVAGK